MPSFDGGKIARQHKQGSSVAALLNHLPAPPIRDHSKANKMHIREIQDKQREERMRAELEDKTEWKLKEFKSVASRCMSKASNIQRPKSSDGTDVKHMFLRKDQGQQMKPQAAAAAESPKPAVGPSEPQRKPRVPLKTEQMMTSGNIPRSNVQRNFISENRKKARDADAMNPKEFEEEVERLKKMFGNKPLKKDENGVPVYLGKIKNDLQEKRQELWDQYQKEQTDVPEGMRVLPEEERIATLESLQQKHEDYEQIHRKLPLKIETEGQKHRQREVQLKLKELEQAIGMFQRPRVLVKMDE